MQKRSPAGVCYGIYTNLAVLLGTSAAGSAGLGLLTGVLVSEGWSVPGGVGRPPAGGGSRPVVLLAVSVPTAAFVLFPLVTSTLAGAVVVVVLRGIAACGCVPAQQHRVIELGPQAVPLLLGLQGSAIHLDIPSGALLGGRVVEATGAARLGMLAVACCGAGLILHALLPRWSRA